MPSSPRPSPRPSRSIALLLATLLAVPVTTLVGAAPAHAVPVELVGTVTTTDDEPEGIPGVTVRVYAAGSTAVLVGQDVTDGDGAYAVPASSDVAYDVEYVAPAGFASGWLDGDSPLDSPDVSVAATGAITVEDAEESVDSLDKVLLSTALHTVSGTAVGSDGPLTGATVQLLDAADDPVGSPVPVVSGAYELSVAEGDYRLQVLAAGYRTGYYPSTESTLTISRSGAVDGSPEGCSPAAGRDLCPIVLTRLTGNETWPVPGQVTDALDDGIDGLSVVLTGTGGFSRTATTATVDETAGAFTLANVPPGSYALTFTDPGAPREFEPLTVAVSVDAEGGLSEDDGSSTAPSLDVALASVPHRVAGTLTAPGGGAPNGVITVRAHETADGDLPDPGDEPVLTTTTATGASAFRLDLPVGRYVLHLSDLDTSAVQYASTWLGGTATPTVVTVARGGVVTPTPLAQALTVAPAGPVDLAGTVLDALGDPISGVTVRALRAGTSTVVDTDTTGATGAYTLSLVAGQDFTLRFSGTGFPEAPFESEDLEGNPRPAVFRAFAGGTVTIDGGPDRLSALPEMMLASVAYPLSGALSVEAPPGGSTTPSGVTVRAYDAEDLSAPVATGTLSGTTYTIALPVGGPYLIAFESTAYEGRWLGGTTVATASEVTVHRGGLRTVGPESTPRNDPLPATTLRPRSASSTTTVTGTAIDAVGEPLVGLRVTAERVGTGTTASTVTTADGRYELDLVNGAYRVALETGSFTADTFPKTYLKHLDDDRADASTLLQVANNSVRVDNLEDEDVVLPGGDLGETILYGTSTGRTISGSVTDGAGPLAGMTIRARTTDPDDRRAVPTATSAANGSFTLALPVGAYQVEYADLDGVAPLHLTEWLGGKETRTTLEVRTTGGFQVDGVPVASLGTVTMPRSTGAEAFDVVGTVADDTDALNGVTVTGVPIGGTPAGHRRSALSATVGSGEDAMHGVYRLALRPGTYQLHFAKALYAPTYLLDYEAEDERRATVQVTAGGDVRVDGRTVESIEEVWLDRAALVPAGASRLSAKPAVGRTLTLSPGTWRRPEGGPAFAPGPDALYVEWFLDGRPADDYAGGSFGQRFKVPALAAGRRLSYRLSVDDVSEDVSRATAFWTSAPVAVPKVRPKLAAAYKKGRLTVTVRMAGVPRPLGTITVKSGKKKVAAVRLKAKNKGKAVIRLKKLRKGRHQLQVSYSGDAHLLPAKVRLKLKF